MAANQQLQTRVGVLEEPRARALQYQRRSPAGARAVCGNFVQAQLPRTGLIWSAVSKDLSMSWTDLPLMFNVRSPYENMAVFLERAIRKCAAYAFYAFFEEYDNIF